VPDHEVQRVAKAVVGDVQRGAKVAATRILGTQGGPGADRTTKERFLEHVRAAWADPLERLAIFGRMVPITQGPDGKTYPARNGVENFEALLREAFPDGYPPPPPAYTGVGFSPDETAEY